MITAAVRALSVVMALVVAILAAPRAQAEPQPPRTLEECDAVLHEHVRHCLCYRDEARRAQGWPAAIHHLRARLAFAPDDDAARLALAAVLADVYDSDTEETLRRAAAGFAAHGNPAGEGLAHLQTFDLLIRQYRLAEADEELEAASRDIDRTGDDWLADWLEYWRGVNAGRHGDLAGAWTHYKKLEAAVFPEGDPKLQAAAIEALGSTAHKQGRYQEAVELQRRAAAMQRAMGDDYDAALTLVRAAKVLSQLTGIAGTRDALAEEERTFQEAEILARRTGNLFAQEWLLFGRAQDPHLPYERALVLLDEALADARRMHDFEQTLYILRYKARVLGWNDLSRLPEAEAILDDAVLTARRSGSEEQAVRGLLQIADLHKDHGERERAIREWNGVLDALEGMRDRQTDEEARAGFESGWAFLYYNVAAYFLQKPGPGAAVEDVDRALGVIERMRARVLLDTLDAAGASSHDVNGPLQAQRAGILRDIARVQRTLLDPALSEEDRAGRMSDLDRLEAREVTSRREMALADPWFARLRAPVIPTLRDLQAALAPEEALVSFQSQLKGSEAGWAVVLTRSDVHTYAIPTRAALRDEVALFLGLVERRDGSEGPGAARLYRELLGDALKDLPPDVRRLVLVPDGPLNGIPWDVLRSDAAAAPLASRYETALAPSCTLWLRWKRTPAGDTRDPVLAVADPILSTGGPVAAASRSATLASALRLGPLPRAREEARALVSELGGGSRLMIGENATERSLKRADLPRFRMLHLAAHTVVDDEHPERSAVLLAPGGDDEDGLLQMREIVQLDLKGAVVVLSSCRSASGAMVEGEGVIGLAHAFFQAGAVAVIGGLWPLRDDETARLVERMAVHLGQGASLSSALQQARLDRIAAGAPPQAWAGLVLLGNGDLVPLPGGRPTRFSAALAFFCAFLALLTGATLFFRRRRAPREIRVPS